MSGRRRDDTTWLFDDGMDLAAGIAQFRAAGGFTNEWQVSDNSKRAPAGPRMDSRAALAPDPASPKSAISGTW